MLSQLTLLQQDLISLKDELIEIEMSSQAESDSPLENLNF